MACNNTKKRVNENEREIEKLREWKTSRRENLLCTFLCAVYTEESNDDDEDAKKSKEKYTEMHY